MAGGQGLELLNRRKQALVAESDLNRLALRVDYENLRAGTAWLDGAWAVRRRIGPWLPPLATIAGLVAARFLRRHSGVWRQVLAAFSWVPTALAIWRQFSGSGRKDLGS